MKTPRPRSILRRLLRLVLGLIALGVTGVIALLALLWGSHYADVTLPAPTGRFAVGRLTEAWVDGGHADPFAPAAGAKREVVVWIWYPASGTWAAPTASYLPGDWLRAMGNQRGTLIGNVMGTLMWRDLAGVHPHSVADAAVSPARRTYPVVILRPGLGALTTSFTTLAEDLASHGYVVVGFDAPYRTGLVVFPDGRVVTRRDADNPETMTGEAKIRLAERLLAAWTDDVGFVVDRVEQMNASRASRFHARLDLHALGVIGHSLGGATALQFCHDDRRCRAGIDLDGAPWGSVVREGLGQPFLLLFSDHASETDPESRRIRANVRSVYDRLPPAARRLVVLRGANHFSFSDQVLVMSPVLARLLRLAGVLRLEPRRGLAVSAEYVHRFFDVHLDGAPAALLELPSAEYPELVESREI